MAALPRRERTRELYDWALEKKEALGEAVGRPLGAYLGSGGYGCAFASGRWWTVKLTCDPLEGPMWQAWLDLQVGVPTLKEGTAVVTDVYALHGAPCTPAYAVVRERVDHPRAFWFARSGGLRRETLREHMRWYSIAASHYQEARRLGASLAESEEELCEVAERVSLAADGSGRGQGLGAALCILAKNGVPPVDVHARNVGLRKYRKFGRVGDLVLFDPSVTPGGVTPARALRVNREAWL